MSNQVFALTFTTQIYFTKDKNMGEIFGQENP